MLQEAGLLKLRGNGSALSTPADVIANQSKVKVKAIDAAQTAASLEGVDGAVVNNNFATDAGLDRNKVLYHDDATGKSADPYLNIIAVKDADKDNPDVPEGRPAVVRPRRHKGHHQTVWRHRQDRLWPLQGRFGQDT